MTTSPTLAQKILPFLIDNQVPVEASIAILAICKNVDAGGLHCHLEEASKAIQLAIKRVPSGCTVPWSDKYTVPEGDQAPKNAVYRMLKVGEIIQEGDEHNERGPWMRAVYSIGSPILSTSVGRFRRPITKTKKPIQGGEKAES